MAQNQTTYVNQKLEFFENTKKEYDLEDLLRAEAELLGKGTFGSSYKAELENGKIVFVKRLKDCSLVQEEFKKKIQELANLSEHHQSNLLPLRAYYYSKDEKLLVFDYMPMMSNLASLLHEGGVAKKSQLTWEVRTQIAYGVTRGLEFLHTQGPGICHGNIRSSNVLLTNSFDALLSDQGLFELFMSNPTLALNAGYQAPEVGYAYDISQKSDVYSFGVLLLELLTSKAPLDAVGGVDLPSWIRIMFQEKPIIDVFDKSLVQNYQEFGDQMVQLLQLAVCCTFKNPTKRPSMVAVANQIKRTCSFKS